MVTLISKYKTSNYLGQYKENTLEGMKAVILHEIGLKGDDPLKISRPYYDSQLLYPDIRPQQQKAEELTFKTMNRESH